VSEARARVNDCQRLLETRLGLVGAYRKTGEFVVPLALADAEIEPPARQEVEGRGLFG
jgi:hypothetical protein